jgi:acyl carrier protein
MDTKFIDIVNKHLQDKLTEHTKQVELKSLGLDSLASIELLLELEEAYDLVIPDELLVEETFSSGERLWEVVRNLKEDVNIHL